MAYVRIDENAIDHPKFVAISSNAFRLWIEGTSYCQKHLTDGFIPALALKRFRYYSPSSLKMLLAALVPGKSPLWHDVEGGVTVHDYLTHNDNRETVEKNRQDAKDRYKRWKAGRHNSVANGADNSVANGVIDPPTNATTVPSLPVPFKPRKSSGSDVEDPKIAAIASSLQEIYPEVYAAARSGAVYRTTQATYERDRPKYYAAAELHPDIKRLRALLEVFLTRPMGDKSSPGTPGQFVNMLPECDEVLRKSGWRATA